ncbi:hypothetical protein ETD86_03445 [Nonomuraea turkmeniaca]|uniref:Uncharacterized protein n=1 Tax=Nonomuraea turkmeniaca TaxID=103838 RepID=A0A5S4FVX1_9ACTN|nr:hypothetical protein [Nonomuraea turkmeniaca]TMR24798.1 hypothetical protein ETD86_03445 [Nonomuraea turkmeniaca]
MHFYQDSDRSIKFRTEDPELVDLGLWLSFDMGFSFDCCLDALARVDDVLSGRSQTAGYDGNDYEVSMSNLAAVFAHIGGPPPTSCPMPTVKSAVEEYWRFLLTLPENPDVIRSYRPELPWHLAALLWWEEYWKRPHPYRGRIEGIPAQGPE